MLNQRGRAGQFDEFGSSFLKMVQVFLVTKFVPAKI